MDHPMGPYQPRLYAASMDSIPLIALSEILQYIGEVLTEHKHAGSYGSLFNVGISRNTRVLCCVFGSETPKEFSARKQLVSGESSISVLIIKDSIRETGTSEAGSVKAGVPTHQTPFSNRFQDLELSWRNRPVKADKKISLSGNTVGEQGDLQDAGTFGFYGVDDKQTVYGFTAAHCTPIATANEKYVIVSPSTLELTCRFCHIISLRKKLSATVAEERDALLRSSQDSEEGCEFSGRKVKIIGEEFGIMIASSATRKSRIMEQHNERLRREHEEAEENSAMHEGEVREKNKQPLTEQSPYFALFDDTEVPSTGNPSLVEWCCFEVKKERLVCIQISRHN